MATVLVDNNCENAEIPVQLIRGFCSFILDELDLSEGELSVSFVDQDEIARFNKQYRDKEGPTDILSFPQGEGPSPILLLGDLLICPKIAGENAKESKQSLGCEMAELLIHGILHLIGRGHDDDDFCNSPMFIEQKCLMEKASSSPVWNDFKAWEE